MAYTNVKIDNETLKEMFAERVAYWEKDDITEKLYNKHYDRLVDEGFFEGADLDIMVIVDNDIINYSTVGTIEDIKKDFGDNFNEDDILEEIEDGGVRYILYPTC